MTADDPRPAGKVEEWGCRCWPYDYPPPPGTRHFANGCSRRPAASGGATDGERAEDAASDARWARIDAWRNAPVASQADDGLRARLAAAEGAVVRALQLAQQWEINAQSAKDVTSGVVALVAAGQLRRALDDQP